VNAKEFADMPEVTQVIGNTEKLTAETYQKDFGIGAAEKVRVNDIMSVTETAPQMLIEGIEGRARAFVQVQNGCDHRCTFCIIPFGRGNSRSVPAGEVVRQIKALVESGYREVVLTGVDITSYGPDLPGEADLGRLIEQILTGVPDLDRLRISSIDSIEIDARLKDLIIHEPRLMPHLHLSLQSGDNMILKRMKRRHAREQSIDFCREVKEARPDMVFGADFIAGFPTETEEMFENTLALVDDCDLTLLHVFPYSIRPGTPAAKMPQVPGDVIKARAARLRAKGEEALARHLQSMIGTTQEVLVENPHMGHTPNFTLTRFAEPLVPGTLARVTMTGAKEGALQGAPVKERKSA
ncbi:MAG: MiaB/RimO family radical SAM methylthiotransferase, partial [Alphaproteobacteria bacterium]